MKLPLKLSLRALGRNFRFVLVNLIGLSVSLAAAIMIGLFMLHETSYEDWLPHADDTYLAVTAWHFSGREPSYWGRGPNPLKQMAENNYPEVAAVTRLLPRRQSVFREGEAPRSMRIAFVDANFFDIFDLPAILGSPQAALADRRSLVLTESAAQELFGVKDAMGQTMRIAMAGDKEYVFRVGAILEDLPSNTHLSDEIFVRLEESDFNAPNTFSSWGNVAPLLYFRLSPGTNLEDFERRINTGVAQGLRAQIGNRDDFSVEISFLSLPQLYFARKWRGISEKPQGDPMLLIALSLVALIILGMAVLNYLNLATAIAMRRTREVALKRFFGAGQGRLVRDHLMEAVAIVILAGMLAIVIIEMARPLMGHFLGIELAMTHASSWQGMTLIAGIVLFTGLAAGLYPSLLISRFRPLQLFADASTVGQSGSRLLRIGLIALQFAVSMGLMASTIVILGQAQHLRQTNLGYEPEGLIAVTNLPSDRQGNLRQLLIDRFSALPGVTSAAMSWNAPGVGSGSKTERLLHNDGQQQVAVQANQIEVDFGFFETLGTAPLSGRLFRHEMALDRNDSGPEARNRFNILLNEAAARAFGFENIDEAIGQVLRLPRTESTARIIGVVPNLRFGPDLGESPRPIFYLHGPWGFNLATIRYHGIAPDRAMPLLEKTWQDVLPDVPFRAFHVQERLDLFTESERVRGIMLGAFAVLAVTLSAIGIYGIAAFSAQRRSREMAIRRVFGASTPHLLHRLLSRFLGPVSIGALIGIPTAFLINDLWLARYSERIVHTFNPYLFSLAIAVLIALAVVGTETIRVARIAPVQALRED